MLKFTPATKSVAFVGTAQKARRPLARSLELNRKDIVHFKNGIVLILSIVLYPLCVQGIFWLFAWSNSWFVLTVINLIVTTFIVSVIFGLIAPHVFYPRKSKSAYLIVTIPILFLVLSGLSSLSGTGEFFISDFPLALSAVMVVNSVILFATVKLIIIGKKKVDRNKLEL